MSRCRHVARVGAQQRHARLPRPPTERAWRHRRLSGAARVMGSRTLHSVATREGHTRQQGGTERLMCALCTVAHGSVIRCARRLYTAVEEETPMLAGAQRQAALDSELCLGVSLRAPTDV